MTVNRKIGPADDWSTKSHILEKVIPAFVEDMKRMQLNASPDIDWKSFSTTKGKPMEHLRHSIAKLSHIFLITLNNDMGRNAFNSTFDKIQFANDAKIDSGKFSMTKSEKTLVFKANFDTFDPDTDTGREIRSALEEML